MKATKLGYKNILVATDFSPASVASLKHAVWLTRQFGCNLVLAHTLPDLHLAVHAASYKARMDLLSGEGEIFEREIRRNSDSRLRQTIADMNATDINGRQRENRKYTKTAEPLADPINDPMNYLRAVLQNKITGTADQSSLHYNMIVMEILDAAKRSAESGKRIVL